MCNQSFRSGYVENNMTNKAIDLFNKIKHPSEVNIIVLLHACAQLGTNEALDLVKKVSKEMPKSFYSNPRLLTSLLNALIKCGDVKHAESLFDTSQEKILSMYGAMMKGSNYSSIYNYVQSKFSFRLCRK
jgi:pentatricopeptide repeat protein